MIDINCAGLRAILVLAEDGVVCIGWRDGCAAKIRYDTFFDADESGTDHEEWTADVIEATDCSRHSIAVGTAAVISAADPPDWVRSPDGSRSWSLGAGYS